MNSLHGINDMPVADFWRDLNAERLRRREPAIPFTPPSPPQTQPRITKPAQVFIGSGPEPGVHIVVPGDLTRDCRYRSGPKPAGVDGIITAHPGEDVALNCLFGNGLATNIFLAHDINLAQIGRVSYSILCCGGQPYVLLKGTDKTGMDDGNFRDDAATNQPRPLKYHLPQDATNDIPITIHFNISYYIVGDPTTYRATTNATILIKCRP
jgi:hypothetical protein